MIAPLRHMDDRQLRILLERETEIIEENPGFWRVEFAGRTLLVITDETHNRMRVMSPVIDEEELDADELRMLLLANFDRALDARYALSDEILWSVFLHPLRELSKQFLLDALDQVATLADNFGGSYSSSDLFFGYDD